MNVRILNICQAPRAEPTELFARCVVFSADKNYSAIQGTPGVCFCIACERRFPDSQISDWDLDTAICPLCDSPAVAPPAYASLLTPEMVSELRATPAWIRLVASRLDTWSCPSQCTVNRV